jgi:hypothetical protein
MLRYTTFDTKFDVASFGVLGYEFNLNDLAPLEEKTIQKQIAFYKKHRPCLEFGVTWSFLPSKRKVALGSPGGGKKRSSAIIKASPRRIPRRSVFSPRG